MKKWQTMEAAVGFIDPIGLRSAVQYHLLTMTIRINSAFC